MLEGILFGILVLVTTVVTVSSVRHDKEFRRK